MKNKVDYFITLSNNSKELLQKYLQDKVEYITIRYSYELYLFEGNKNK